MKQQAQSVKRIESIDIIRGLTILVMIFVNDLAGVNGVPDWMKHMPTYSDGMTFVDLVFPAFLFIVGMSMPFSIGRRLEKGDNPLSIWKHSLIRIFGLLVIGIYMVNSEVISEEIIINRHLWAVLVYACVMVIWNKGNTSISFLSNKYVKYFAVAGLVVLAFLYRGQDQEGIFQMRTYWWGILGLIGWAYLMATAIYFPLRKNSFAILGGVCLLYCFYMAYEAGLLSNFILFGDFIHASGALGSHTGIVLSGVLLGIMIKKHAGSQEHKVLLKWSLYFSLFLFIAGLLLHELKDIHQMFIISKNLATVPWCLISSALTIWIWMLAYWLVDMKDIRGWTVIVKPAGANPLFAYILAPFVIELLALSAYLFGGFNFYYWLGETFIIGFIRAVILAFSMTWLAGYLSSRGLQLKL